MIEGVKGYKGYSQTDRRSEDEIIFNCNGGYYEFIGV